MKTRKFITFIVALAVIMSMSVVAFAATTYSNPGTFKMSCGGDWTRVTTLNEYLGNQKETDSTSVTVYTLSKTMSSVIRMNAHMIHTTASAVMSAKDGTDYFIIRDCNHACGRISLQESVNTIS